MRHPNVNLVVHDCCHDDATVVDNLPITRPTNVQYSHCDTILGLKDGINIISRTNQAIFIEIVTENNFTRRGKMAGYNGPGKNVAFHLGS